MKLLTIKNIQLHQIQRLLYTVKICRHMPRSSAGRLTIVEAEEAFNVSPGWVVRPKLSGPTHVTWCSKINNVARFRHCSIMFPGNMASRDPCSRGTWYKPCDTMHLCRFFGLTALLGRSIRILCCCVMDGDTNLLHLFRDITKQILTVSLDQHWKIIPFSCAVAYCTTSGIIFQCCPRH